ncbi:hypothetical protein SDC9_183000 [bioreactor metagenome]|uniref:Uncharacterized protein n=1 Tax=bioreactor metagenome TaxID=1076179 RepID=A0A645HAW2_9ZZZZ
MSVVYAKSIMVGSKRYGNHGETVANAAVVSSVPFRLSGLAYKPDVIITKAVIVQITTVSIKGSSSATYPSVTGCCVLTVEWAMAAEPIPASFENAALLNPIIITPMTPPFIPSGVNAPLNISTNESSINR